MCNNTKSCISANGQRSDFFECYQGLRQVENLSPILLFISQYMYIYIFENNLLVNGSPNVDISSSDLDVYLKLVVLLYADDTVVFTSSQETLIQTLC